jgi:pyrrolidone-carboxylate peptidase
MYIYGVASIQKLLSHIENNDYDYVIGLGDFTKNAKNIRVESKFINKFFRNKISTFGEEYLDATALLPILPGMHISSTTTHGPCNRSAYLIAQGIKERDLNTKIGYLHIPGGMDVEMIRGIISKVLVGLK